MVDTVIALGDSINVYVTNDTIPLQVLVIEFSCHAPVPPSV